MPETAPDQPRYVDAAVETDNAEAMRVYLKSLGYAVPDKVRKTPTYDLAFHMKDPDGNAHEIMQYTPESLSVQSYSRSYLNDDRPSTRILHVGDLDHQTGDHGLLSEGISRCVSFGVLIPRWSAHGQRRPASKKKRRRRADQYWRTCRI